MRNRIIYGILKTYKGIFVKKHIGNVQIFIIEMDKIFFVFNVLGLMENGLIASQMLLKSPSEYVNIFIDDFEESENFIQLEEIYCDIPNENEEEFSIILKKKGKYLNSNYKVSYSNEYSSGNIKVYLFDGKFSPLTLKPINNIQLRMKSMKKQAVVKPLLSKFISSITR